MTESGPTHRIGRIGLLLALVPWLTFAIILVGNATGLPGFG